MFALWNSTEQSRRALNPVDDSRQGIAGRMGKMLAQTLRDLEADGLVIRQAFAEVPPRVEYTLTDRSRSLMPHIHDLVDWALDNLSRIVKDREAYRKRNRNLPVSA